MKPFGYTPFLRFIAFLFFALISGGLFAQTLLYSEDFNDCSFPNDWGLSLSGYSEAVYYAGMPDNPNSDGSTIDGSCMLIFDDDATGDQTPPWNLKVNTPSFDGTQHSTLLFSVDVHFRNVDGSSSFKIHVWDGTGYHQIANWQDWAGHTGAQFSEYITFTADLSFYAHEEMHVMFEFDDGDIWAWWAGIDNIEIVGEGFATNVIKENFDDCNNDGGWIMVPLSGEDNWQIGLIDNDNAWASSSMNGTCFAYFDDDGLGEVAPFSTAALLSPLFDGSEFAHYTLDFDVIFRRYSDLESLQVLVFDGVDSYPVATYLTDLGGPQFNEYVHETLDLSAFRSPDMYVAFLYSDGNDWGWWAGIDNVKVSGYGEINDLCTKAVDIYLDEPCLEGDNTIALFDGDLSLCDGDQVGSMWYLYSSPVTGIVHLRTQSDFNDLITIYTGDCDAPVEYLCDDTDEHGFTGEDFHFDVEAGTDYYIRLSGKDGDFGIERGSFCIELVQADSYPENPLNDLCDSAIPLVFSGDCLEGNNYFAASEDPIPSMNELARSNVWFRFEAPYEGPFLLRSLADFADDIALFQGACNSLVELASTHLGRSMETPLLIPGSTYYVSVSGNFATIEGNLCVRLESIPDSPQNDDCFTALPILVDGTCVGGSNIGANLNGPSPSCHPYPASSIWYSFEAPSGGSVHVNTGADFVHTVALFYGECDDLQEIYCGNNPLYCDGFFTMGGLDAGETYYLQIASADQYYGIENEGSVCISILDGQNPTPFDALEIVPTIECQNGSLAIFEYSINGGIPPYNIIGTESGVFMDQGDFYLVILQDANGCEVSLSGNINCGGASCDFEIIATATDANCFGEASGEAFVEVQGDSGPFTYLWPDGQIEPLVDELAAGSYLVSVIDVNGCENSVLISIDQPDPILIVVDTIIPSDPNPSGMIEITVSGGEGPYTYSWYLYDVLVSNDEDPTGLSPGIYTVEIIDNVGCASIGEVSVGSVISVPGLAGDLGVELFPNPNNGAFYVRLLGKWNEKVDFNLFDVSGRLVHSSQWTPGTQETIWFDVTGLAAGVYELNIRSGGNLATESIAIIR